MAKQVLQRLSFTAGELTPWLAGRADLDPVSRGASRLINFLVSPFGGLRRRPGTRLVARAGCREGMVRLVSFKYSTGVQFMLEVGRGYVRYFKNGALLTDTEGGVLETLKQTNTDHPCRTQMRAMGQTKAHREGDMRRHFQQHFTFCQRLAHQAEFVVFQVAQATVDEFGAGGGGGAG